MTILHPAVVALLSMACAAAAEPVVITLDPAQDLGPVNRLVLGHNIEAANGKDIFSSKTDTDDPKAGKGAWDVAGHRPVPDTVAWAKAIGMGMLRYPGGCLTHNFDWHQAVGPVAERTYFSFGIDEYLTTCRAIGCEPLITVSEIADPAAAADLVEYLNAPADAAHPWAAKRAAWGHPEPWRVTWFEMANESDHGNHDVKPHLRRTAAQYADWVVGCAAAMRAVDPGVRIGAHMGTGTPVSDPWNEVVLRKAGAVIDDVVVHTYAVGSPAKGSDPELVGRACMAATDQIGHLLEEYRTLIRSVTGRDIPLAVTEYNAGFSAPQPPWRFSFAAAMHSADQLRWMLEPEHGVVMANYWQFLNGYWGFLHGPEIPPGDVRWTTTAAAPLFRLWGSHLGARLVGCTASGVPRLGFPGFMHVMPAHGDAWVDAVSGPSRPLAFAAVDQGGVVVTPGAPGCATIACTRVRGSQYPTLPAFPVRAGWRYRLTWEAQVSDAGGMAPGMGLCDVRGWDDTHSACGSPAGEAAADGWARGTCEMQALPDATALTGVIRLIGGDGGSPRIVIRNAAVTELSPRTAPAFPAVTTLASLASDGHTLHLVLFNKQADADLPLRIRIADGSARSARIWSVSGPFAATNREREEVRETLGGAALDGVAGDGFACTLPARSMTAIDIAR